MLDELGAADITGRQGDVDDGHIGMTLLQRLHERLAVTVAGDDLEAAVVAQVEGRAAADDVMVIKQGQAKPARCRESVHAQECCQRPVAWRSFWRRCRVEHRKRSIFETFPRV